MKKLLVSIVAVALAAAAFAVAPADFKKKVPITVNAEAVGDKSADDVPVLVRISESAISGFSYADLAADGSDLAFGVEGGDGNLVVYPHEIDTWDTSGESLVWVKVPTLSAATAFDMYYGNGASGGTAPSATWSNYTGVWHLNETNATATANSYGEYKNSTATAGIDGNLANKSIANEAGKFGKSFRVNDVTKFKTGNYNYGGVWVPGTDALKLGSTFAISGWFKNGADKFFYDHLFYKRAASSNNGSPSGAFACEVSGNGGTVFKIDARGSSGSSTLVQVNDSPFGNWVYVTLVYDNTKCHIYSNGAFIGDSSIAAVTDNDAALAFGNNCKIADGAQGDAAWAGWIDEVRLQDGTPDATWIALEYAAMGDGTLAYGSAQTLDATMPKLTGMSAVVSADGSAVTVSANFSDNMPTAAAVEINGTEYAMSTTATAVPATYTVTVDGLAADTTYDYAINYGSTGGTSASKASENPFYLGVIAVVKTKDADEMTLAPGLFTVSRADTGSALAVNYTVGGTAVARTDYQELSGTVTIPAGAKSAQIEVTPIFNPEQNDNVTVAVTLVAGAYAVSDETKTAELTIVNASTNPYVQYVATDGDDANDGMTMQTPKLTIAAAVDAVQLPTDDSNAEVIVAPGTYAVSATILLDKAVTVRSSTGVPDDVVISKKSGNLSLVKLNHATAKLLDLTVTGGGGSNTDGGNVYIDTNGGVVEHCVIASGNVGTHNKGGGNIYMKAGVVTRCIIRNGVCNYAAGGGGVWMSGGQVENSLIYGNAAGSENGATYSGDNGGGVHMTNPAAKLVNCTIYANRGASRPGVKIDYNTKTKSPKGSVVNCVIVDNKTMAGSWDFYNVGGDQESAAGFVNCMTDAVIAQPNDTCFGAPYGFVDHSTADYRLTAASAGVDAGSSEVELYSDLDLNGNPRVSGGAVDVGCYELQQTAPAISAAAGDEEVLVGDEVAFTAAVKGGTPDGDITWDFGDGTAATGASVTHAFATAGWKAVTVSATVGGEPLSATVANVVKVCAKDIYVSGEGSAEFPYDTPETGVADFATAFAGATDGSTVHVGNGFYLTTSQTFIDKAIVIEGIGDSVESVVITNKGTSRIFWMAHEGAKICNLTIAGGKVTQASAANVYVTGRGGMVSNCVISAGWGNNYGGASGNLSLESANGLVTHCVIKKGKIDNNGGGGKGANVNMTAGRLEHSLIVEGSDNGAATGAGVAAGVRITGGTMAFCTIANNSCQTTGGVFAGGGTVSNCVIAANKSTVMGGDAAAYQMSGTPVFVNCYSDTSAAINENCFTATAEELIADAVNGNYRAAIGSPSIDAGMVADVSQLPATDLAGGARVQGKAVDIGCYEYEPPAFAVSFVADKVTGFIPATITFTATAEGADDGDKLNYYWDFDGDGIVDETTAVPVVAHEYAVGAVYTVGLKVEDVTKGLAGTFVRENYIKTAPKVIYVDGACETPAAPYGTWETAAANLPEAVEVAIDGCEIVVREGLYVQPATLNVEKQLYIRSETQKPDTVVLKAKAVNYTLLFVNSGEACVNGLTLSDATGNALPGGVHFGAAGGTVTNCVVRNCKSYSWSGNGAGVYFSGPGLMTHSVFSNCTATSYMGGGTKHILAVGQGRFENNLVVGNYSSGSSSGSQNDDCSALMAIGATAVVRNNTFVGNTITGRGLLSVTKGAQVVNNVFAGNSFLTSSEQTPDGSKDVGFNYGDSQTVEGVPAFVNCATDLAEPINETCLVGTVESFFNGYAAGDFMPKAGGPLVNAGATPEGWEKLVDLRGKPRVAGKAIDIGCYELQGLGILMYIK